MAGGWQKLPSYLEFLSDTNSHRNTLILPFLAGFRWSLSFFNMIKTPRHHHDHMILA